MKTLNNKFKIIAIVALVVIAALCAVLRVEQRAQAQDQTPPPQPDRISFGMVGITSGQTARINVTNTDLAICPCQRVVLTFRGPNGQLLRNRSGEVIRRSVELQPGESTFLDLNFDEFPPGPSRLQLRAVVTVQPPPSDGIPPPTTDRIVSTVEVINNATGRTDWVLISPLVP